MLNKILNLKGISKLDKIEQQSIMAGNNTVDPPGDDCSSCSSEAFIQCILTCNGTCSITGTCYQSLH